MWVPALCLDTMYGPHSQPGNSSSTKSYRDRKTRGGFVSYSLITVAVVAFVVAPAVTFGVALGVVGTKLRERVADLLRRRRGEGGVSAPDTDAGHPA
jgi:hypothetical protein